MIKKCIFIFTLLCIAQPVHAKILEAVAAGVLVGGTVYAACEAKEEVKKLDSNKVFQEQKKQLTKDIQEMNLKKIGSSTKNVAREYAKPVLLTAYAVCTGTLALALFIGCIE